LCFPHQMLVLSIVMSVVALVAVLYLHQRRATEKDGAGALDDYTLVSLENVRRV
jgi:hypothetical protein